MKKRTIWITGLLLCVCACFLAVACKKENKPLQAPQNVKIENEVLTWDEVENATGYTVDINGKQYETESNSLDIFTLAKKPDTAYTLKVVANDKQEKYPQSEWSEAVAYSFPAVNFTYNLNEQGNAYIITGINAETAKGKVVLPSSINDLPVMTVQAQAFKNCMEIEGILISNSVSTIEVGAFEGCSAVKRVHFGKRVDKVNAPIFNHNGAFTLTVSADNEVYRAEENCLIKNDGDVLVIGQKTGIIPESVKKLGDSSFQSCIGLESITVPTTVKEIGQLAFARCESLQSVTISNGVKKIGDQAFAKCDSLKQIVIPRSVTEIGVKVFDEQTTVLVYDTLQKIGSNGFGNAMVYTMLEARPEGWDFVINGWMETDQDPRVFYGCEFATENGETYVSSWKWGKAGRSMANGASAYIQRLLPQRKGYTFVGWALDKAGENIVVGTTELVVGETVYQIMDFQVSGGRLISDIPDGTVVYAVWQPNA